MAEFCKECFEKMIDDMDITEMSDDLDLCEGCGQTKQVVVKAKAKPLICDVCNKNEACGVYASSLGPVSFAYCEDCKKSYAEPYDIVVAVAIDVYPDYANWFEVVIEDSLKVAGKTRDEFDKEIKEGVERARRESYKE